MEDEAIRSFRILYASWMQRSEESLILRREIIEKRKELCDFNYRGRFCLSK